MNIKKYLLCSIVCISGAKAEHVTFKINKNINSDDYKIRIEPTSQLSKNLAWPASNFLEITTGKITQTALEITTEAINHALGQTKNDSITKKIQELDDYIRTHIINSMSKQTKNEINITIELSYLTTFNKAYRDLYNAIRDFSKDLATLAKIKDILPDLAPQAWFFNRWRQKHPKITDAAAATGGTALGLYALWKKMQQGDTTPPTLQTLE